MISDIKLTAIEVMQLSAIAKYPSTEPGNLVGKDSERLLRDFGLVKRDNDSHSVLTKEGAHWLLCAGCEWIRDIYNKEKHDR